MHKATSSAMRLKVNIVAITFLPELATKRSAGGHRALFRLFEEQDWRFVMKDGSPALFANQGAARNAARDVIRAILNPTMRSEVIKGQRLPPELLDFMGNKHEERARQFTARKRGIPRLEVVVKRSRRVENAN